MSVLEQYLDPAFVYTYERGPRDVRSIEDALTEGVRCDTLAHLGMVSLFGFQLPEDLECAEMFTDTTYFETVDPADDMEVGDLVWFGPRQPKVAIEDFIPEYDGTDLINWDDFPVKHVGIFIGMSDSNEPLILHATHHAGTNVVWSLSMFQRHKRYQRVVGVTRLKEEYRVSKAA